MVWVKCSEQTWWLLGGTRAGSRVTVSPEEVSWPSCGYLRVTPRNCFPDHEPRDIDGHSGPCGFCKRTSRWCISVAPKQQSSWLHELPGDLDSGLSPGPSFWKWIHKSFLQVGRQGATSALSEIFVLHFPTFQFRIEEKGKKNVHRRFILFCAQLITVSFNSTGWETCHISKHEPKHQDLIRKHYITKVMSVFTEKCELAVVGSSDSLPNCRRKQGKNQQIWRKIVVDNPRKKSVGRVLLL